MNHLITRVCLLTAISTGFNFSLANEIETTESADTTTFCLPQTQVRGGFENLVIDHNKIIPADDHFKSGDIFVGARLKSDPESLWLLSGITWRRINNVDDLHRSQYQYFEQLPMVVPISVFNSPFDARGLIGDVEVWIGYGLRSVTESAIVSFNEMTMSGRHQLLWEALPSPYLPASGIHNGFADICLETTRVRKISQTVQLPIGSPDN